MKELEMSIRDKKNEEIAVIQQENEELKEVLSAVQVDLETKTEVRSCHILVQVVLNFWMSYV